MRSMGDVLDRMAVEREATLSDHQRELRDTFLGYIELWNDGTMSLADVNALFPSGYQRFQILRTMTRNHPLWDTLMLFFDADNRRQRGDGIYIAQGFVTREEIEQNGGILSEESNPVNGDIELVPKWPIGYAQGIDGKPDKSNPIYGPTPQMLTRPDLFVRTKHAGEDDWMGQLDTPQWHDGQSDDWS